MRSRSAVSNLCTFTQYISGSLDNHRQIDVVYADFSKAFDKMSHKQLLRKLARFGISVDLRLLLKSYLDGSRLYVEYEGVKSYYFIACSGVPQGSNLGPLLFLMFINDVCNILVSLRLLFADDLKFFRDIVSIADCVILQDDIRRLSEWCSSNKLPLNIEKCEVMSYSRKLSPIEFDYTIEGKTLKRVVENRDLGVLFDRKLSFSPHLENIICG